MASPNDAESERHSMTTRLPKRAWNKLRELSARISKNEGKAVSANEVINRLIMDAPLPTVKGRAA